MGWRLNLGGFEGSRNIVKKVRKTETTIIKKPCYMFFECEETRTQQVIVDITETLKSSDIDWMSAKGQDLRRVQESDFLSELKSLKSDSFNSKQETYLWGCNAGGQLDLSGKHILQNAHSNPDQKLLKDPRQSFAQKLAKTIGVGKVFALVGKGWQGGSTFKTDSNGKAVYMDGELLPANISANHQYRDTANIDAEQYLIKFPL